jgi:hypothetical protein
MYAGEEDVDRVSKDLSVKDLERLVRHFSSLSKKQEVPASCRVEPYSGIHALPKVSNYLSNCFSIFRLLSCFLIFSLVLFFILQNHRVLSSLPPLPEGGEVDERTIVTDESQEPSRPESEVVGSHKSAASSKKETDSEASESVHSPPSVVSPRKEEEG